MDDHQLIIGFRSGDSQAFGKLYDAYADRIYAFVYFRVLHVETAEDLTGQVFLKALEKIGSFNPERGAFRTWLYQIARNTLTDYWRTRKVTIELEGAEAAAAGGDLETSTDHKRKLAEARQAIAKLPERQRDVLIMRIWEDRSYEEIAELLNASVGSIKMQVSRSLRELRGVLEPSTLALLLTLIQ